jgi:hypothetical protein
MTVDEAIAQFRDNLLDIIKNQPKPVRGDPAANRKNVEERARATQLLRIRSFM